MTDKKTMRREDRAGQASLVTLSTAVQPRLFAALVLLAAALLMFGPAGPLVAQDDPPQDPPAETTSEDGAAADDLPPIPEQALQEEGVDDELLRQVGAAPMNDLSDVEDILDTDVELRAGGGDRYDSGTRRDPFRSLVQRRRVVQEAGPRPEGKPGLLIDEIYITGIFNTHLGDFAQVRGGVKDKSYLLQAGDQLFDGDVISIGSNHVVFRQNINDPEAIKPFREVTKPIETEP